MIGSSVYSDTVGVVWPYRETGTAIRTGLQGCPSGGTPMCLRSVVEV